MRSIRSGPIRANRCQCWLLMATHGADREIGETGTAVVSIKKVLLTVFAACSARVCRVEYSKKSGWVGRWVGRLPICVYTGLCLPVSICVGITVRQGSGANSVAAPVHTSK